MSKATQWTWKKCETAEQWLARLEQAEEDGLKIDEQFIFSVRLSQARSAARRNPGTRDELVRRETETILWILRLPRSTTTPSGALARARDAFLMLTPAERQDFLCWIKAGALNEQAP